MAWLISNDLNYKTALQQDIDTRSPFLEQVLIKLIDCILIMLQKLLSLL
jgi:hypothetical protein